MTHYLLNLAGAIPENTGRRCVGVGFMQPVIFLMVSFRDMSSLLVWKLRLHTGVAYSALLQTIARAAVWRVLALTSQVDLDRHRIK